MPAYLTFLLIPVIGYFSWACARAYGVPGFMVFLCALLVVCVAVVITPDAGRGLQSTLVLGGVTWLFAILCGAFGVAKRRAALQSAGMKTPNSG